MNEDYILRERAKHARLVSKNNVGLINIINSHIEGELQSYRDSTDDIEIVDSFEHGILEGRREFAQGLWELINEYDKENNTMNKQLIEAVKEASISVACCLDEVSDVTEADLLHIQEQITHIENHLNIDRNMDTTHETIS